MAVLGLLLTSCSDRTADIAELRSATGIVERLRGDTSWSVITPGAGIRVGDWARTGKSTEAVFDLRGAGRLVLKPSTTVRFLTGADAAMRFDVDVGALVLEAGGRPLEYETALGRARLLAGAAVTITPDQMRVEMGTLTLLSPGAEQRQLGLGALVSLSGLDARPVDAGMALADAGTNTGAGPTALGVEGSLQVKTSAGWKAISAPVNAVPGLEFRVDKGERTELSLGDSRVEISGPAQGAIDRADDELILRATSGRYGVRSGNTPVGLAGSWGRIETDKGGGPAHLQAQVDQNKVKLWVVGGRGRVVSDGDEPLALEPGAVAELGGRAPVVHPGSGAQPEVVVPAGERASIWAPDGRATIAVGAPASCNDGLAIAVHRASKRASLVAEAAGLERVTLPLAQGEYRYQLTCFGSPAGETPHGPVKGTLEIVKRRGSGAVSGRAPPSVVDADGRLYEVHYQNRLPALTFRWPSAEAADRHELRLTGARTVRRQFVGKSVSLPSGAVPRGKYRWRIARVDGQDSSPEGELHISLDPQAATAAVSYPSKTEWTSGRVVIRGSVAPGWSVRIDGANVEIDKTNRFRSEVDVGSPPRPIAVRLSHPVDGVRYYLRRP